MISQTVDFISSTLDQFLRNRFGLSERTVVSNDIVEARGTIPRANQNKVVISLINIEKETVQPFYSRLTQVPDGSYSKEAITQRYNLDLLVTSNFDVYDETLKFLNAVLLFFQINELLDAQKYTRLPEGVERLEFHLENINYHQMHSLWNAMGAKYRPSVIYRTRLLSLRPDEAQGFVPEVLQVAERIVL